MPLTRFEGREPVEITEYEYDDGGHVVRAVTTREPEWTEYDQAAVVALAQYRAGLCECCGLPKAMTQVDEKDAPQFIVSKRYCLARRTLIESEQAFTNRGKDVKPTHKAIMWSVRVKT